MGFDLILNPFFEEELRCSPQMLALVRSKAEAAKQAAVQIAPVGDPTDYPGRRRPGSYRRGMRAKAGIVDYPGIGRTAVGRLYNVNYKAGWIEYGTSKQSPNPVLSRAVEQATPGAGFDTR